MRDLTKKQIKMLDAWYEGTKSQKSFGFYETMFPTIDDMDLDIYEKIDALNPCEIYHQNVERYLWDKRFEG